MSKVDAQRAMKAARHARTEAAPTPPPVRRTAPVAPAAAPVPAASAAAPVPAASASATAVGAVAVAVAASPDRAVPTGAALCGHRSMAGKECRRPAGHSEKSHRYS